MPESVCRVCGCLQALHIDEVHEVGGRDQDARCEGGCAEPAHAFKRTLPEVS